ncbi:MAG: helix-turn-helix domain-containing protein [Thermodesulfobacteriota bacterium]
MEFPGKYLKAERESRNLSLKEVSESESTKIREHLLKAIEEDQYELISSPVYVKAFLNICAKYLGLNPDNIIKTI